MSIKTTADNLICRLLWLEPPREASQPSLDNAATAERAFGASLMFSALRCILQYVILPFVLPVIGLSVQAAMPVVLAINLVAIFFIIFSLRRFWQVNYKYKWQYLPVAAAALVVLTAFVVMDINTLLNPAMTPLT